MVILARIKFVTVRVTEDVNTAGINNVKIILSAYDKVRQRQKLNCTYTRNYKKPLICGVNCGNPTERWRISCSQRKWIFSDGLGENLNDYVRRLVNKKLNYTRN